MAETKTVEHAIEATELKQKQTVINLDTQEETEISLVYSKFSPNPKLPVAAQLAEIAKMVTPDSERILALCAYASSQAYQIAKARELAKGNYLTSQIRSAITGLMGNMVAYAENSAKDNFGRWLAGYKAKKASAVKLLDLAKASISEKSEMGDL